MMTQIEEKIQMFQEMGVEILFKYEHDVSRVFYFYILLGNHLWKMRFGRMDNYLCRISLLHWSNTKGIIVGKVAVNNDIFQVYPTNLFTNFNLESMTFSKRVQTKFDDNMLRKFVKIVSKSQIKIETNSSYLRDEILTFNKKNRSDFSKALENMFPTHV